MLPPILLLVGHMPPQVARFGTPGPSNLTDMEGLSRMVEYVLSETYGGAKG